MNREHFEAWLRNIFNTQDVEISCTECFDSISQYVEIESSGQDVAAAMPQVKHHLGHCVACRDEYEVLIDLVRLEDEGSLPSSEELKRSIR